ncbi:transmembrane protein 117 [Plakobranchus ocellatus]|uniref:Transmembrane protein 117 n=1 Tax=Plakobranchus ocellatus TaxID=259542 RepID=A0AAV4C384_9GAST|nr:transmembrane protein 117 [Plakobranchus ocellatus]
MKVKGQPQLVHVQGLKITELDTEAPIVVENNNKSALEQNFGTPLEMNEQTSVKFVQDEIEEKQPLNTVESLAVNTRALDITMMEGSGNMRRIPLAVEEEVTDEHITGSNSDGERKHVDKLSPVMEVAVAAFASGIEGKNGCDLNKNTTAVPSGVDRRTSLSSSSGHRPKPRHPHLISKGEIRTDSFEIATKDDVDAGSVYSLFMEKDFRYHFQHPYFRLFTAYFVTFCNFLIYAEDPVAHSRSECTIPVIGNDFSFVIMKWPPNAWSLLKVIMWLSGIITGIIIGKIVFHSFLFSKYLIIRITIELAHELLVF